MREFRIGALTRIRFGAPVVGPRDVSLATRHAPDVVQHHVHGNPVKPRSEGAFAVEVPEALPRADKYILNELLGTRGVARHTETQGVNSSDVPTVERFEGVELPAPHPVNEREIADAVAGLSVHPCVANGGVDRAAQSVEGQGARFPAHRTSPIVRCRLRRREDGWQAQHVRQGSCFAILAIPAADED
ncbi:MAG: hypothetical protein NVS4B3_06610 [Gemmatimonadaceae bacterium]